MTLWPISMFSRILATASPAVPTIHAGGKSENSSTARLLSSSVRCTLMTLRMYAASRAAAGVQDLLAQGVELASQRLDLGGGQVGGGVGLAGALGHVVPLGGDRDQRLLVRGSQRAVRGGGWGPYAVQSWLLLEVDLAGAGRGRDAGLDADAVAFGGGGELAVAQVADAARAQRHDAAEADAHPAARRHQHAGVLAGVEDGGGAVGLDDGAAGGRR